MELVNAPVFKRLGKAHVVDTASGEIVDFVKEYRLLR